MNTGDFDGAIESFTKAIKIDPGYVEAITHRGVAQKSKGNLDSAIADFSKAIGVKPSDAIPYYNRGSSLLELGRESAARQDFERYLNLSGNRELTVEKIVSELRDSYRQQRPRLTTGRKEDLAVSLREAEPNSASLLEAAKVGDLEQTKRLLNRGINPNIADNAGFTPLHFAVQNGSLDLVKVLIENSANVHAQTENGFSVFQLAEIELRWPTRQSGATPLHVAAKEHSEIVQALIAANAEVNAFYAGSFTPLHIAALSDQMRSVEILISNGADVNARHWTRAVGTPLDMVQIYGSETMAQALRRHGATTSGWAPPGPRLW